MLSYRLPMLAARVIAVLLVSAIVSSQEVSSPQIGRSDTPQPKLPVIDYHACPGKGKTVPHVKISQNDEIRASWQGDATSIGVIHAGEEVTIVGGVNVIREPDSAVIKYVGKNSTFSSLKAGDAALSYGIEANGDVVFWSKGLWFTEWSEAVADKGQCGFTLGFSLGGCTIDIIKKGKSEWWVQVKTRTGLTGWVLAVKIDGDKYWSPNFSDLCHYGED